jgi:hypothetical protein
MCWEATWARLRLVFGDLRKVLFGSRRTRRQQAWGLTMLSPQEFANKYLKLCVHIFPPEDGGPDNSSLARPGWQEIRVANYRLSARP